ncbi:MAG: DHHA1 domain-containing protein [Methanomassiliicoccales archaeon]|nr:DHHA1 domain-containing protein [Methanomassiliicoccales archaeon]
MTRLLYESDPYMARFDATVEKVNGDWVALDRTAFFPGGGGQDADTGWIEDLEVVEVKEQDGIWHRVPDHAFTVGQRVEAEIDWERRHDLMRGHTGEHLLFSALNKINPELELIKIAITPKKKSFIVRGQMSWALLGLAQAETNAAIASQLPVSEVWVSKDSPLLKEIRIKVDRIHGEKVRIVNIGEIDKAACAGVHIQNTRELKMLLVTKLSSARPAGDYEIEFKTAREAMESALTLSIITLQAAEGLGANPEDLVKALDNLKSELEGKKLALKRYSKEMLANLEPEKYEGVRIYSGSYQGIDKKALVDCANQFASNERSVCIMSSSDDKLMLIMASSKDLNVDCKKVLTGALESFEGKGGGGRNFASGGANAPEEGANAVKKAISLVKKAIDNDK